MPQRDRRGRAGKQRRPGAPNPVSDARGGPGNLRGVEYQLLVAADETLTIVADARRRPADLTQLLIELREFVADGQLGYDVGVSRPGALEVIEAKAAPKVEEVREFVARLETFGADDAPATLRFVFGTPTAATKGLDRLIRHAHEATSWEHLQQLAASSGTDQERDLLTYVTAQSWTLLRRCHADHSDTKTLTVRIGLLVGSLASPDRTGALRSAVDSHVRVAGRTAVLVMDLVNRWTEAGLLLPAPAVDTTTQGVDARLVAALTVLECAETALPREVVMASVEVTNPTEFSDLLAESVAVGAVHEHEALLFRRPGAARLPTVPVQHAVAGALRALVEYARGRPAAAAADQTPNALSLARTVINTDPDLVSHVFVAFDKPSKAYGDLGLVQALAELSTRAGVAAAERADGERARELLVLRARNYVCGESWTYQRIGELQRAYGYLRRARELSQQTHEPTNAAFADKCEGRICRMLAESPGDESARERYLQESETLLRTAFNSFEGIAQGDRHFAEEPGECLALLARTYAVWGRHDDARSELARAFEILEPLKPCKAWADAMILRAELRLHTYVAARGSGAPAASTLLEAASGDIDDVLQHHPLPQVPVDDRATSEIAARAHLVKAAVFEEFRDTAGAAEHYSAAAGCYHALGQPHLADEATYRLILLDPQRIPAALSVAFDASQATPSTRVEAIRMFEVWRASQVSGTMDPPPLFPEGHSWWTTLIADAAAQVDARRPRWGEQGVA